MQAMYEEKNKIVSIGDPRSVTAKETAGNCGEHSQASWARKTIRLSQSNHGTYCADDFAHFLLTKSTVRQSTSTTPKQDIPTTASHSIDAWAPVTAHGHDYHCSFQLQLCKEPN